MNNNQERVGVLMLINWALHNSFILSQRITCLQFIFQFDFGLGVEYFFDLLFVVLFTFIKS